MSFYTPPVILRRSRNATNRAHEEEARTLKDSSLTLRVTGWRASPVFKMRADKIIHPITKSEFFC
ncbi:MAG TPA: hypothetical protein H9673_03500 [Candidatus Adamsella sp.]|nr:hypothetical protein [Candidatus Adamsella sp.]